MKRVLTSAIIPLLALSIVAGCASKTPSTTNTGKASEKTAAQGNVTLPYPTFDSLDHAYWQNQLLLAQGTIYEGLVGYDDKLNIVNRVLETADHSTDFKSWTFVLRKDKKWSNGDPVTAKDFYAAWIRFLSPALKDAPMWAGNWGQIENAWAFKSGAAKESELGIKLKDDYTLEVKLVQSNPSFPNFLTMSVAMPIDSKVLAAHANDWWDPQYAAFNGPFVVKSWTKGGDTVLERNPNYVGDKPGNVTQITLKNFADGNTRMQAFENGEIQYAVLDDAAQVEYVKKNAKMKDGYKEEMALTWSGFQWDRSNVTGAFGDVRVRQAFAKAVDKTAITDRIMKGRAVAAHGFTGDKAVLDQVKALDFNVADAKKLLADAGFPDGKNFPEITLYAPPATDGNMPMIEAVAKMWQENLGVKVVIQNMDMGPYGVMQWADQNKNIKPGYTTMIGAMNFIDPWGLAQNMPHIWWFMDFKPGYSDKLYPAWKDEKAAIDKLDQPGEFAALQKRADALWTERQKIIAAEQNSWGKGMHIAPLFNEQFKRLADAYSAATDAKAKLEAYKNAANLVADEAHNIDVYANTSDNGKKALRVLYDLQLLSLNDPNVAKALTQLNQMAVDSAWMIPIYVPKITYVTDPKLSGIVQNKLTFGNIFNFNYLNYNP